MTTIEQSIDIEVPVAVAYNQWTQFESFPQFMDGVERVDQKTDTQLHWVADIGGSTREWDAEITEQHPDHRVAWKALDQEGPDGVVTFHKLDDARTRVMVQMDYEPEGVKESVGSMVGLDDRRVSMSRVTPAGAETEMRGRREPGSRPIPDDAPAPSSRCCRASRRSRARWPRSGP